jgi:hypothetical protein
VAGLKRLRKINISEYVGNMLWTRINKKMDAEDEKEKSLACSCSYFFTD